MCVHANISLPVTFDPMSIHQRGPSGPSVYTTKWTVDTDAAPGPVCALFRHMTHFSCVSHKASWRASARLSSLLADNSELY